MRAHQQKIQSGQVIVIFALFLFVLVAAIGLAIDSGMGYLSKAKLNSAVDAAAIAAARAAIKGDTQAEQTASATEAAREFFAVNYPANYLQSTPVLDSTSVAYANGKITIDVAATATLPTSFMRVANVNQLVIRAGAETVRKDLDLAFVIDTSGSMNNPVTQDRVRQASKSFLEKLNAVTDRVSLIQFASGAQVRQPFKPSQDRGFDRGTMKGTIDAFNFEGATNSAEGLWHARDQLKNSIVSPSSLRF
ncbi:MAG: VWA domain-containing protein, partial [Herminiimonas sp.]|nr:VWA domain-containing protein [Herminiimonas sp.]